MMQKLFDSAYTLSKHSNHKFRHLMLCLKVANNATNNYQSRQSLYDFLQLSLRKTTKEPKLALNIKMIYQTKRYILKTKISLDCTLYLNLEIIGHRSSNRKCPVYYKNWRFA